MQFRDSIPSNSTCTRRRRQCRRCIGAVPRRAPIFDIFRGVDTQADIIPTVRVEVRNGTGTSGQGKTVLNDLADQGFVAVRSTDARDFRNPGTVILYAPGQQLAAANVARYIDGNPTFQEDASLSDVSVALVTGNDFTAIRRSAPAEDFQSFLDAPRSSTKTSVEPHDDTGASKHPRRHLLSDQPHHLQWDGIYRQERTGQVMALPEQHARMAKIADWHQVRRFDDRHLLCTPRSRCRLCRHRRRRQIEQLEVGGEIPILEAGLDDLLRRRLQSGS